MHKNAQLLDFEVDFLEMADMKNYLLVISLICEIVTVFVLKKSFAVAAQGQDATSIFDCCQFSWAQQPVFIGRQDGHAEGQINI